MRAISPAKISVLSLALLLTACRSTTADLQGSTVPVSSGVESEAAGTPSIPADWPEDVSVYPGGTLQYSATINATTGQPGSSVVLLSTDSMQAVADYYTEKLPSDGWTIESNVKAGTTLGISASKDRRTVTIFAASGDGKTAITIGVE